MNNSQPKSLFPTTQNKVSIHSSNHKPSFDEENPVLKLSGMHSSLIKL